MSACRRVFSARVVLGIALLLFAVSQFLPQYSGYWLERGWVFMNIADHVRGLLYGTHWTIELYFKVAGEMLGWTFQVLLVVAAPWLVEVLRRARPLLWVLRILAIGWVGWMTWEVTLRIDRSFGMSFPGGGSLMLWLSMMVGGIGLFLIRKRVVRKDVPEP